MLFDDLLTKLFGDSDPELDTTRLAQIRDSWQVDIVSGDPDDPILSAKEKGVEIIAEVSKHGRWRSTTKGRGK